MLCSNSQKDSTDGINGVFPIISRFTTFRYLLWGYSPYLFFYPLKFSRHAVHSPSQCLSLGANLQEDKLVGGTKEPRRTRGSWICFGSVTSICLDLYCGYRNSCFYFQCEIRLQNLDFDPDPLFHFEDRLAKSLSIVAYTRRNDRN